MKLIVGLGNPGERYKRSRHNVGYRIMDKIFNSQFSMPTALQLGRQAIFNQEPKSKFKSEKKFEGDVARIGEIVLLKPTTFMNESGRAVRKVVEFYKIALDDVWLVHDDLDIAFGKYKTQKGRGPKIHYGVNSVEKSLGSGNFWRIRVGVDNRKERLMTGDEYVMGGFSKQEEEQLKGILNEVTERVMGLLTSGD